jgi:type VI secretion system secreted protein VgrG
MPKTTQKDRLLSIATPLGPDYLLLNKFQAGERVSDLFEIEAELLYDEEEDDKYELTVIDGKDIIGKTVSISIAQDDGGKRTLTGMVNNFTLVGRNRRFTFYNATIVPHVWMLTRNFQSRIFQHKTVEDILREVFKGFEVKYQLQAEYKPRNFCVQYQETDFAFASRLMEEEGIYYYFEHTAETEKMVLRDDFKSPEDCPNKSEIPIYNEDLTGELLETAIKQWQTDYRIQSGKVTLWDYHFQLPKKKLEAEKQSAFDVGNNKEFEVYEFPAGYARKYDDIDKSGGERSDLTNVFPDNKKTIANRMLMFDSQYKTVTGLSDCCTLTPGYRFQLRNHPNKEFNIKYIVLSVQHNAEQSPDYIVGDTSPNAYINKFTCIPHGAGQPEFRPALKTSKPIIYGSQTAVVVGPAGEEIFTDKYGRVKVQFHWDRDGKYDPDSACWLRVATSIAGNKWGTMFIPRIGQEVVVDFLGGDPDQPIIVGSVYNPETMPHYELPKFKTLSYIKTRTSPDDGKGFNELRFEDKQGKEQVFIHSQKRMDVRVRQSLYETCGGNRQERIGMRTDNNPGGNLAVSIGGNYDLHVKDSTYIGIDGKLNETVKKDVVEDYQGNLSTMVKTKAELNAMEIILEAKTKISLKVGGNCIVIDPIGITIAGTMTKINSGGFGTETGNPSIDDPLDAEPADTGQPGYLDRPRSGSGRTRNRRQLNSQHYIAPPRPGESPQMTAIRNTLQHSARGRRALEVYDRYNVNSTFNTGVGGGYTAATNTMNLDPAWGDFNNSAFVHEMNHTETHFEGTEANRDTQSRQDYIDTRLRDEARANALGIQAADELAAAGHPQNSTYDRASYDAAYNQAVADTRAANPNATQEELDAAGRSAGEAAILDDYRAGRIRPSDINGVRQPPYPDYYGNDWDAAHPSGGSTP